MYVTPPPTSLSGQTNVINEPTAQLARQIVRSVGTSSLRRFVVVAVIFVLVDARCTIGQHWCDYFGSQACRDVKVRQLLLL